MPSPLSLLTEIVESPIGPRGVTVRGYLGRKAARTTAQEAIERLSAQAVSEAVDEDPAKPEKKASVHPVLLRLASLSELAKLAALYKEAPFKSEAQRRKFFAMAERGEISKGTLKEWVDATPKGKKLPERLHKKEAILGALPLLTMVPGKAMASRVARGIGWGAIPAGAAVAGAKAPTPTATMAGRPKFSADRLLGLAKQAIEIRQHMPASTDVAEPDVKKNDGKIAQVSASSSSVTARTTASSPRFGTRGPSSRTPKRVEWYMRGLPGDSPLASGPAEMNVASGVAPQASSQGGMGASHVQRPTV